MGQPKRVFAGQANARFVVDIRCLSLEAAPIPFRLVNRSIG
jgi:hypothetical protein